MQNQPLNTMRVLWFALLTAQGVFAGVSLLRPTNLQAPAPAVFLSLAAVAMVSGALSFVIPRRAYRTAALGAKVVVRDGPSAVQQLALEAGFRTAAPVLKVFDDTTAARRAAYRSAMSSFILSLALSESVGIHGLAAAWMGVPLIQTAPFYAVAVVLVAMRFPTEAKVIADFEAARGAHMR